MKEYVYVERLCAYINNCITITETYAITQFVGSATESKILTGVECSERLCPHRNECEILRKYDSGNSARHS